MSFQYDESALEINALFQCLNGYSLLYIFCLFSTIRAVIQPGVEEMEALLIVLLCTIPTWFAELMPLCIQRPHRWKLLQMPDNARWYIQCGG